ncbi:hypothetical protein KI688_002096 [Linnemannia hyalina]|uniref:Protein kinase domain-containing protein n=1 Tax=Linnemannia hyalina TaxID=64524 RepID=A0A9P8BRB0_9FUNG|nr:hypothetical protein KI688_002096 [Linnemannia hyalina]
MDDSWGEMDRLYFATITANTPITAPPSRSLEKSNENQVQAAESQEMDREESREESQEKDDSPSERPRPRDKDIQREVTTLEAAGKHTHLIKYFGTVEDPSSPCLLFELYLSRNLNSLLSNRGAINEEETRYFSAEIAIRLTHLHDRGLIHCDLKPENIFFASSMRVRIGNLGLAERFDLERSAVIELGLMEEAWLTKRKEKHPEKPETLLHMDERKLNLNAKDLVRLMLEFDPKKRQQLKNLYLQKVFKFGYSPTVLNEDLLWACLTWKAQCDPVEIGAWGSIRRPSWTPISTSRSS